jgi:YHS domain-containing protein
LEVSIMRTGIPREGLRSSMRYSRVAWLTTVLVGAAFLGTEPLRAQKFNTSSDGLAVKGYDVVAYFDEGRPVKGTAEFTHDFQGATYRFASAGSRDRFAKEPARYVPQYGAFCAYAVSRGYTADTDPLAWRIVNGKLYLNYNKGAQQKWEEDVPGNIAKGDANWPGLSRK